MALGCRNLIKPGYFVFVVDTVGRIESQINNIKAESLELMFPTKTNAFIPIPNGTIVVAYVFNL